MCLQLCEVTAENWQSVALLSVEQEQAEFIESNSFSIAQSRFEPHWKSVGLYDQKTLVGFAMFGQDNATKEVWLDRFMIDKNYQGRGYAKKFLPILMSTIKQQYECDKIYLSISPSNEVAQRLYESHGFQMNGEIDDTGVVKGLTMVADVAQL